MLCLRCVSVKPCECCSPVLDPLQLDIAAEDGVDDVVEHVRVLHLRLHYDLLPLRTLQRR